MVCRIYSHDLELLGQISAFISLVWSEGYSSTGSAQLVCSKTPSNIALLKVGHYIGIAESDTLQEIHSVDDDTEQIWVYADEAKKVFSQRVYLGTLKCKGRVEKQLRRVLKSSRMPENVEFSPERGLRHQIQDTEYNYPIVEDVAVALCEASDYGYRLRHDRNAKKLLFDIYEGEERPSTKFSDAIGNITNVKRTISLKNYKNVCYVKSDYNGETVVIEVDKSGNGRRFETVIEVSDIDASGIGTRAEFERILRSRGEETLKELLDIDSTAFDLISSRFGVDYSLGDIVSCILPEYNVSAKIRITGFTYVYENNIKKTSLTLGNPIIKGA